MYLSISQWQLQQCNVQRDVRSGHPCDNEHLTVHDSLHNMHFLWFRLQRVCVRNDFSSLRQKPTQGLKTTQAQKKKPIAAKSSIYIRHPTQRVK